MKSEPKTPLQLRAESMINDNELLANSVQPNNQSLESAPYEPNNEALEPEEQERKEVDSVITPCRTNRC